nr:ABC transporter substrate-binding protein [Actinomycetota bacterium]
GGGAGAALPAGAGAGGGTGSAPGGSPAVAGTAVPASGHGWDAKHVYVGVVTTKDTQQVYGSYGANNVDPGDTEAQATAVATYLNAHGGILGRTVVPIFHDIKTLDTAANPASTGQSVCTFYTQDHPVVAVWNVNTQLDQSPTLRSCLAQGHVPLFTAAARAISDAEMAHLAPYYYHTIMVSWDAVTPVFVQRLKVQGWLGGWNPLLGQSDSSTAKVGILTDSTAQGVHTGEVLKAAFAKAGYPGAVIYQYSDPSQGQASSVYYFHGNGVTHVVVTDVELTAFQNAAESQHYHPRYGITSYNDPYSNLEASGLTPTGANNGAMGVGWAPNLDVGDPNDPGESAGGHVCNAILKAANQNMVSKRLAHLYAFSICDAFRVIAMGAGAGRGFSPQAIAAGVAQTGGSFSPANGFAPALTGSRPYMQGAVRDLSWVTSCSCMRYGKATFAL